MATDPISFQPQSTDQLPGDTSPDTYRVLERGRVRIATTDYTLSGSWYRATAVVDLGQFKFATLPMIEFYTNESGIIKAPYIITSNAGAITSNVNAFITAGTKAGATSTKITFNVGNTHGGQIDIYYQVMSLPAGGLLFP